MTLDRISKDGVELADYLCRSVSGYNGLRNCGLAHAEFPSVMRTMKSFFLSTALALCASAASGVTAWEQYLAAPTPSHASQVTAVEYSPGHPPGRGLSTDDIQILQNQVLARDREAFRLALRLYRGADGGNAEDLGVVLARSVRAHPDWFLRQIAELNIPCSQLSWPLNAPGLEYVDRPAAADYEIAMRQEALRSVGSKSLRHVRDDCLRVFTKAAR